MRISSSADQAREAARQADGRFGDQNLPEPALADHPLGDGWDDELLREYQPTINDGSTPYQLGEMIERDGIRARFVCLDEGLSGDYDPDDPDDEPLLRLDIETATDVWPQGEPSSIDPDGRRWVVPPHSSECTLINRDTATPQQLRLALERVAKTAREMAAYGTQPSLAVMGFSNVNQAVLDRMEAAISPERVAQQSDGTHRVLMSDGSTQPGYTCGTCGNGYATEAALDAHDCAFAE